MDIITIEEANDLSSEQMKEVLKNTLEHILKHEERHIKVKQFQTCRFCENRKSILTKETCCTGCSKLEEMHESNDSPA